MALTETQRNVLQDYLADGESVLEATADEDEVTAVTDRRILELTASTDGNRDRYHIRSSLLSSDRVIGTDVLHEGGLDYSQEDLVSGGGIVLVGFGAIYWGISSESLGIVIAATTILLCGLWVAYQAFDTQDGHVTVTIQTTDGENKEVTFDERDAELAQAISRSIGGSHGPE